MIMPMYAFVDFLIESLITRQDVDLPSTELHSKESGLNSEKPEDVESITSNGTKLSDGSFSPDSEIKPKRRRSSSIDDRLSKFDSIVPILLRIGGVRRHYIINADADPPSALEGGSVVYVLHIEYLNDAPSVFYVGETESIRQRLAQHRYQLSIGGFHLKI